ncbi:carbohydrate esterase family 8 protein [Oidiodendron maius Zn]|uniref:Pectinesterase n=1 Tax=Oidiodendron maius (strain Zn) TaxID=913774 RepID=A0A0C3H9Z3_OIDMZ|nr:carbohydrate esterase family 8 protein [Oidiodendron maius Zn]
MKLLSVWPVACAVCGVSCTSRTSPPNGCLTIRASGAEYSSLSSAINTLGQGTSSSTACIFLYPGTYNEQVIINNYKGALTIYGYTSDISSYASNQVTITHSESAAAAGSDEASSTLDVRVDNFRMYNVNVANSYGKGSQAIALTSNGNQQSFYGCGFYGYQDTLYAHSGYQYYKNCLIQGAVDYIFGDAPAWFEQCTIQSTDGGAITAMHRGTTSESTFYVINNSQVEAAPGYTTAGGVYLGRPWGIDARVIYQHCSISNIINSKGWTTMAAGATPTFMEYGNEGAGATTTARQYETRSTAAVSLSQIFSSGTYWIDSSY